MSSSSAHEHTQGVFLPLGNHVDNAGELEQEQADVVTHVRLHGGEVVEWPNIQVLLLARSNSEFHF